MPNWEISEIESLKGFTVEWDTPEYLIVARRNILYEVNRNNLKIKNKIGTFPLPFWKRILIRSVLMQRFFRGFFYNVIVLQNKDIFVTFGKSIGLIKSNGEFKKLSGIKKPFRVLRNSIAEDEDGNIYFGEYSSNKNRKTVSIYKYSPGKESIETRYTFNNNQIRHIHGIYYDKYSNSLWCLTGDVKDECKIIQTFDGFETMKVIGSGDETWRAVSILFAKDAVYYAMDAEFQKNKIFMINRSNFNRTELTGIDGPVYYSIKKGDDLFFQVTAELCPSQTDKNASLWKISNNVAKKIWTKQVDPYPQILMPGTINFSNGVGEDDESFFHCIGLLDCTSKTFKMKRI